MFPRSTIANGMNGLRLDAKSFGYFRRLDAIFDKTPDFLHLRSRHLRPFALFTARGVGPLFRGAISHVVFLRSKEKVLGVDAGTIVARVADKQAASVANENPVRLPVCANHASPWNFGLIELPVASLRVMTFGPVPALVNHQWVRCERMQDELESADLATELPIAVLALNLIRGLAKFTCSFIHTVIVHSIYNPSTHRRLN